MLCAYFETANNRVTVWLRGAVRSMGHRAAQGTPGGPRVMGGPGVMGCPAVMPPRAHRGQQRNEHSHFKVDRFLLSKSSIRSHI